MSKTHRDLAKMEREYAQKLTTYKPEFPAMQQLKDHPLPTYQRPQYPNYHEHDDLGKAWTYTCRNLRHGKGFTTARAPDRPETAVYFSPLSPPGTVIASPLYSTVTSAVPSVLPASS